MEETLAYIASDPKARRIMQEEYWAALNEILWENQVTALTNEKVRLENEYARLKNENVRLRNEEVALTHKNAALRRLSQQADIDTSSLKSD